MADGPTLNWLTKPMTGTNSIHALVNTLRSLFLEKIDQVYADVNTVLCINNGYTLSFSQVPNENTLNPLSYEGAGEISTGDGHLPILFFATLRKLIVEKMPQNSGKLTFCTEEGEPIRLDSWDDVKDELKRLGFFKVEYFEKVRSDAEAVGFVDPIYRLDKLGEHEQKFYF